MADQPPLRSFGRIKGRPLKPRQAALIETLLPRLAVPHDGPVTFPRGGKGILEIGFGAGEHLVAQAAAYPDMDFVGVEPFLNGVGACLAHIDAEGVSNIRIHQGDAREIVERLPDASLARVYVLFPDPWPKTRHWKRRIIQPAFIADLARVLEPGGEVRFATDWAHYAAWTLERFMKDPHFGWLAECAADWRAAWPGHFTTRYEQKRLGDCAPIWLRFARR